MAQTAASLHDGVKDGSISQPRILRLVRKRGPKHRMIFVAGTMRGGDNCGRYDRDGFTPLLLSPPIAGL